MPQTFALTTRFYLISSTMYLMMMAKKASPTKQVSTQTKPPPVGSGFGVSFTTKA